MATWVAGAAVIFGLGVVARPSAAAAATGAPTVGMVTDLTWGISRADMDRTVALLTASGVKAVRLNVSWSGVERDAKGVYNTGWLAELDAAVSKARGAGLEVLMPIADGVPYWASADPAKAAGAWNKMWKPARMSDYGDFVGFVVRRYSPMGVSSYEIWNEPNLAHFWPSGVNAASYTDLLRAGSAAVRAANPSAQVVLGGLSKSDRPYMAALYAAGAGGMFDVAAIHPYVAHNSPNACWNDAAGFKSKDAFCGIEAVRDVMVANGDSAKPLWLTEFGWSTTTATHGVSESLQATYLTDAFAWLASRPYVAKAFWYSFRNKYWLNDDPADYDANTGVLRTDFSPKLAFAALSTLTPATPPPPPPPTVGLGVAYHPLTPARILDSRPTGPAVGPYSTAWAPGQSRDAVVAGAKGVPAGASAVVLNATVTNTTGAGHLTISPAGQARPLASSLNWGPGQTIPNAVTVKVGDAGKVSVFNAAGFTDVIFDVVGYYDASPGDGFTSLTPARIQDSRATGPKVGPYGTPWSAGLTRDVKVTGAGGVPTSADAVVLNATVTNATAAGFLTIWPAGQARPLASSLNWAPGSTIANAVTVKVGDLDKVSVFNAQGDVDVVFDVVGYFASGTGALFHPMSPVRIQDSRPAGPRVGSFSTPWGPGTSRQVKVAAAGGIPADAVAALLNVTVTNTTASSFLTIWPAGEVAPLASSLNSVAGQTIPNSVTAKIGSAGNISISNAAGNLDVIADAAGWYS